MGKKGGGARHRRQNKAAVHRSSLCNKAIFRRLFELTSMLRFCSLMMRSQAPFRSITTFTAHKAARNFDQALGLEIGSWSSISAPRGKNVGGPHQALRNRSRQKSHQEPTLGYRSVSRGQGIQVQQALEPFEKQFRLPAQPIEPEEALIRELRPTQRGKHPYDAFLSSPPPQCAPVSRMSRP